MHYTPVQQGLQDKIAVVTGGASGIGAAVAECFWRSGATVEVFDITGAHAVDAVDVADPGSVNTAVDAVVARHGGCDIVINAAGVHAAGSILDTEDDEWNRLFAVNVTGVRNVCRSLLPHMRPSGAIVNVASAAGVRPNRESAAYVATKAAIVGITKALAVDHAAFGIRANCVCPGLVETPMLRRSLAQRSPEDLAEIGSYSNYLVKRAAAPDEIAASVAFLASDSAAYITGSTLVIDGGRALH